jgi:hypothetical protein
MVTYLGSNQAAQERAELLGFFSWTDQVEKRMRALLKGGPYYATIRDYDRVVRTLHTQYMRGIDERAISRPDFAVPPVKDNIQPTPATTQAADYLARLTGATRPVVLAFFAALYNAAQAGAIPFGKYAPGEVAASEAARRAAGRLTIAERAGQAGTAYLRMVKMLLIVGGIAGAGFLLMQAKPLLAAAGIRGKK